MSPDVDRLADLLKAAGPRAGVPGERALRVELTVRLEWKNVVERRKGRRRAAWVAATCLTSAALIALVLHTHAHAPADPALDIAVRQERPGSTARPQERGPYFRATDDARPADRGLPRHVLASYAWEER
jgi:hypothetical protein